MTVDAFDFWVSQGFCQSLVEIFMAVDANALAFLVVGFQQKTQGCSRSLWDVDKNEFL
jgi:hypothetical protein